MCSALSLNVVLGELRFRKAISYYYYYYICVCVHCVCTCVCVHLCVCVYHLLSLYRKACAKLSNMDKRDKTITIGITLILSIFIMTEVIPVKKRIMIIAVEVTIFWGWITMFSVCLQSEDKRLQLYCCDFYKVSRYVNGRNGCMVWTQCILSSWLKLCVLLSIACTI